MSLNFYLQKIIGGQNLSEAEAAGACEILLQREMSTAATGALLAVMRYRGEAPEELVGFVQNIKKRITPFPSEITPLTDIANIGAQALPTVTLGAALLLAALGARVAKLMPRGRNIADADLMPMLGLPGITSPHEAAYLLENAGIGFLNMSDYFGGVRTVRVHQESLGMPSSLDTVLALVHPAPISSQLIGIADIRQLDCIAQTMRRLRYDRAVVVAHESASCPFTRPGQVAIATLENREITQRTVNAADYGLELAPPGTVDLATQTGWLRAFIDGRKSPIEQSIIWMTACALLAAGRASNLEDAVSQCHKIREAGQPAQIFSLITTLSRRASA